MNNIKTVKQLADEFNVSKQAIRKRLTVEFREKYVETVTSNGVQTLTISKEGYILLKEHFIGSNNTSNLKETVASNTDYQDSGIMKLLEHQLSIKDMQLESKDVQISQLQNLLDQQQQLALQDKKLLTEYKNEIEELKSLEIPKRDLNDSSFSNQLSEENIILETDSVETKKWWQFWK